MNREEEIATISQGSLDFAFNSAVIVSIITLVQELRGMEDERGNICEILYDYLIKTKEEEVEENE